MLLKLLPLDGCVSFRNTKVSQKKDRKSFWEQVPLFGKINIRGQTLSWRWRVGSHPTLYMTYSTGVQAWDSVFLQKLQRGEGYDASSWYTEMRFIVGRDSFPIHRSTGTSQFRWLRFPVEWKWGASLGMYMIGNNNVKLQGNVSASYGISEALRIFCQRGVPFKKILEKECRNGIGSINWQRAKENIGKHTVVKSYYVWKIPCTLRLLRSE